MPNIQTTPLTASSGVVRVTATMLAASGVGTGLIELSTMRGQAGYFPAWWYAGALIAFYGLPAITAVLAFRLVGPEISRLAAIVAVGQLVVIITWVPALSGGNIPWEAGQPWILAVCTLPTGFAAIAWRGVTPWAFALLVTVMVSVVRLGSTDLEIPAIAILDALRVGIAIVIVNALILTFKQSGRHLDTISTSTARTVEEARCREVVAFEQARFGALMHDGILNTLLVAGRDRALTGSPLSQQANDALAQLAKLQTASECDPEITGQEFIQRQRAVVNRVDERVRFGSEKSGDARIPTSVSDLISGALVEALRNSIRHADVPGRVVNRAVQVILDDGGARVFVLDDGAGFDATSVDRARMGITVSILARMRQLAGGDAEVRSAPGAGTTVALRWRRS